MHRARRLYIFELIFIIVINLSGSSIAAELNQSNNETISLSENLSNTIIIVNPGDKIQDAIQGSSPGNIIEVQSGVYHENINVSKRLIIRGIDGENGSPVVDAQGNGSAITVSADGVQIEYLTVANSSWGDAGILVTASGCIIKSINARENHYGIDLFSSNNSTLFRNNARDSKIGIRLDSSNNNSLLENDVVGEGYGSGITLIDSKNNLLAANKLNKTNGIRLSSSDNNSLLENDVVGEGYGSGITLIDSKNNSLAANKLNKANGISLSSSDNNSLLENDVVGKGYDPGITLHDSKNNSLAANKLNKTDGIRLSSSDNNSLLENDVVGGEGYDSGITLHDSKNNSLAANNLRNNAYGINLDSSGSNRLSMNLMSGNKINFKMDGVRIPDFDNDIDSTNLADGRRLYYFKSARNRVIDRISDALIIGYFNCTNVTLRNQNISDSSADILVVDTNNSKFNENNFSIRLYFSNNNTISKNRINNDGYGILLRSSDNNTMRNNIAQDCDYGFRLESSNDNALIDNYLSNNMEGYDSGIELYDSKNNSLAANKLNKTDGISLSSSNNNSLQENDIVGREGYDPGITLHDSKNNSLAANKLNKTDGISLSSSDNNSLLENDVVGEGYGSGITLHDSKNNSLAANNLRNNEYGINLDSSGSNRLSMNLMSGNKINFKMDGLRIPDFDNDIDSTNLADGKRLYYLKSARNSVIDRISDALLIGYFNCTNVTLRNQNISGSSADILVVDTNNSKFNENNFSIRLYFSNNNTISKNKINSDGYGILLRSSDNNTMRNNMAQDCDYGFRLESSDDNAIIDNYLSNNMGGISLLFCEDNTVLGNDVVGEGYGSGIELYNSENNSLANNNLSNNYYGINLDSSSHNILSNNSMFGNLRNFRIGSDYFGYLPRRGDYLSDFDNEIDATNLVNGRSIYYLKNATNKTIDFTSNAEFVYCINCTNINIVGLNITNVESGIYLIKTDLSNILSNEISYANEGIFLYLSNDNNIKFNNVTHSSVGIYMDSSNNNILENNSVSSNISNNAIGYINSYNNRFINNSEDARLIHRQTSLGIGLTGEGASLPSRFETPQSSFWLEGDGYRTESNVPAEIYSSSGSTKSSSSGSTKSSSSGSTKSSSSGSTKSSSSGSTKSSSAGNTSGKNVPPQKIDYGELLEEAIGRVLFNPPDVMYVGIGMDMDARISANNTSELYQGLIGLAKPQTRLAPDVVNNMDYNVTLTGAHFTIKPLDLAVQTLDSKNVPHWVWHVTPLEEGNQTLILNIIPKAPDGSTHVKLEPWIVRVEVIEPSIWKSIEDFIRTEWKWFLGGSGIGVIGVLYGLYRWIKGIKESIKKPNKSEEDYQEY